MKVLGMYALPAEEGVGLREPPINGEGRKFPASFRGSWLPHRPPPFQSLSEGSRRLSLPLAVGEGLYSRVPVLCLRRLHIQRFPRLSLLSGTPLPPSLPQSCRKTPRLTWTQFWPLYSPDYISMAFLLM